MRTSEKRDKASRAACNACPLARTGRTSLNVRGLVSSPGGVGTQMLAGAVTSRVFRGYGAEMHAEIVRAHPIQMRPCIRRGFEAHQRAPDSCQCNNMQADDGHGYEVASIVGRRKAGTSGANAGADDPLPSTKNRAQDAKQRHAV